MSQYLNPQDAGQVFGPLLFGDGGGGFEGSEKEASQTDYFRRAIVKMSRILVERWLCDGDKCKYENGRKFDEYLEELDEYLKDFWFNRMRPSYHVM